MRFARWITKGANTHSEYVMFYASVCLRWLRERALILRYTYTVSLLSCPRARQLYRIERHTLRDTVLRDAVKRTPLSWQHIGNIRVHAVVQLGLLLCYRPEGRGFDSRWGP